MKKLLFTLLSLIAVTLCVLLLLAKNRQLEAAQARAASAEASRDAANEQAVAAANDNNRLRERLQESRAEAAEKIRSAQKTTAPSARHGAEPPDADADTERRAALFRDPDMREALLAQAKEGAWKNVKALFNAGLAEQLHLNDEQASALRQLLAQKLNLLSEKIYLPMMTGELDDAAMAASGRATRQAYESWNAQIRQLLGDDGFAAFERFEKTQPERENLRRFLPQFAENGQPLTSEQQNQLLGAMMEERLNFNFQHDLGNMAQWDFEHWYDNVTDEKLAAHGQEMNQLDARMVERARAFLSPEQVRQFEALLRERALQAKFVVQSTKAMTGRR